MRKQSPVGKALERIVFNPENLRISVYGVTDGIARLSKAGAAEEDFLVFIESALPEPLMSKENEGERSSSRGSIRRCRSLPEKNQH